MGNRVFFFSFCTYGSAKWKRKFGRKFVLFSSDYFIVTVHSGHELNDCASVGGCDKTFKKWPNE